MLLFILFETKTRKIKVNQVALSVFTIFAIKEQHGNVLQSIHFATNQLTMQSTTTTRSKRMSLDKQRRKMKEKTGKNI